MVVLSSLDHNIKPCPDGDFKEECNACPYLEYDLDEYSQSVPLSLESMASIEIFQTLINWGVFPQKVSKQ
jgi:hypothetical protein